MSADEKAEHDRQKMEAKLQERENELNRRELRAQALETLGEKGLPKELADVLNYANADVMNTSLTAAENVFRQAVDKGVTERLKGETPKASQGGTAKVSAEDAGKMSYSERVQLFQTDKESYEKLFGGK